MFPGAGSQFGLGDVNISLFFSPRAPSNGVIWGVGPVLYLPTATDDLLGADKWGAGPAVIVLTMRGPLDGRRARESRVVVRRVGQSL